MRPVDVVEDQQGRLLAGERLDEPACGVEHLAAVLRRFIPGADEDGEPLHALSVVEPQPIEGAYQLLGSRSPSASSSKMPATSFTSWPKAS